MPKFIDTNENIGDSTFYDGVKKAKKESEIIVKYQLYKDDILKDEALNLAEVFKNEHTLVINDYSLVAGGLYQAAWNFYNANQPVIKFATQKIADVAIGMVLQNGISKFTNLFKKSVSKNFGQPIGITIYGPKASTMEFSFFSYFDDEDISAALTALPQALTENTFQENLGKIFIFDTKKKKWFLQGSVMYLPGHWETMDF
jgi:hypothetical protein